MLRLPLTIAASLALATTAYAVTFVDFDVNHLSYDYYLNDPYSGYSIQPDAGACATFCSDYSSDIKAYIWQQDGSQNCYCEPNYPSNGACSGFQDQYLAYVSGLVDRCSGTTGYKMAGDGTCIYTAGADLTDARYLQACPSRNNVAQASPATYKRKRRSTLDDVFRGGKVCPIGEQACPVESGLKGTKTKWGCVDVKTRLNSCGGCIGGGGVDCSEPKGVDDVSCQAGQCIVHSCSRGFSLSPSGGECEPTTPRLVNMVGKK